MKNLVRSNASAAWLALATLTWVLGTQLGLPGGGHVPASLVVLGVAVFKIRLVGMYFMELREAPMALRGIFEGYCVVLLGLLVGGI